MTTYEECLDTDLEFIPPPADDLSLRQSAQQPLCTVRIFLSLALTDTFIKTPFHTKLANIFSQCIRKGFRLPYITPYGSSSLPALPAQATFPYSAQHKNPHSSPPLLDAQS